MPEEAPVTRATPGLELLIEITSFFVLDFLRPPRLPEGGGPWRGGNR